MSARVQPREIRRLARLARAFNHPGELRRLLGDERARQLHAQQREISRSRQIPDSTLSMRL